MSSQTINRPWEATMPVIDDIRAQRDAVRRNGTFRQRAKYFWDYNKCKVLLFIFIGAFVLTFVYKAFADPEILLNGIMLNVFEKTGQNDSQEIQNEFLNFIDAKPGTAVGFNCTMFYSVSDSTDGYENYQTMQKILTDSATGDLDFITADRATMTNLAYYNFFYDLREVLNEEQLKKYETKLLYIDLAVLAEIKAADRSFEDSDKIARPDCARPEAMEKPVPVLIDISAGKRLTERYNYSCDTLTLGVSGEKHTGALLEFLKFVIE